MPPARPTDPRIREFAAGLRAILDDGNVEVFRWYLVEWEELLGDLAQLTSASEAELRRTMGELRRRPSQFGLPPWSSADAPPSGPAEPRPDGAETSMRDGGAPATPEPVSTYGEVCAAPDSPGASEEMPSTPSLFPLPPDGPELRRGTRRQRRPDGPAAGQQPGLFDALGDASA